ncbi:MAG TPA: 3'-5' exonuclease [Chromatiales bacterium]|nr:3'-5' exonuclease [Chromatiales bacterium]
MFGPFVSLERRRARALADTAPGPLHDYLAVPFPSRNRDLAEVELVVLDLETTGLDPGRDRILSMGWVLIRGLRVVLASAQHHILRVDGPIPEAAAVLHEITDDRAARGAPLESILPQLLQTLAGRVMVAHHARLEQRFLDAACRRDLGGPFLAPTIDTLVLARRVLERRNHTLQSGDLRLFALGRRFGLPAYKAHDALYDALATAELFLALVADIAPRPPRPLKWFLSRR